MTVTVVIGLQWGDEGKGKIVDVLSKNADIVVRFSGGANAAHTVSIDGQSTCFHLVPSGAIHKNVELLISDGVIIEPRLLYKEIITLQQKTDFDISKLHIGMFAPVTFPFHILLDQVSDRLAGVGFVGTTGTGVGPTRVDHTSRQGIRIFEYLDKEFMLGNGAFQRINKWLTPAPLLSQFPNYLIENTDSYQEIINLLQGRIVNSSEYLYSSINSGKRIVMEGSQGALLDINYGLYPYVTSSSTLAGAACIGTGIGPTAISKVIGVVKAYSTRVSNGLLISEVNNNEKEQLTISGNEYIHSDPSHALRVGWLDLVSVLYSLHLNHPNTIALTKLDVLDKFDEIKVCVAYKKNNEKYFTIPTDLFMPNKELNLKYNGYKPVYKVFKGWKTSIGNCRTFSDLPTPAKEYILFIEEYLQTPIDIISIGADRNRVIIRD